jgi:hypothetical protein
MKPLGPHFRGWHPPRPRGWRVSRQSVLGASRSQPQPQNPA